MHKYINPNDKNVHVCKSISTKKPYITLHCITLHYITYITYAYTYTETFSYIHAYTHTYIYIYINIYIHMIIFLYNNKFRQVYQ